VENPESKIDSRIRDLFEPSMIISFFALGSEGGLSFPVTALSMIFQDIGLTTLVVFFLWRNGEPIALIGWKFKNLKKEAALGVGLYLPVMIGAWLLEKAFQHLGLTSTMKHLPEFLTAKPPLEILLAGVLVTVVAITEETIFRGYLMLRFNALTASLTASVIITSGVFALGHGYEGPASAGTTVVLGMVLALIYVWRKSLIAPVVIHFLVDFFPLVFVPLVKIG